MKKAIEPSKKKDPPKQHQDYDNVLKKSFTRIYQSIIHKLLGLDMRKTIKLPTSFSRTKEKRSDFAIKVSQPGKKSHITHVEFQSGNDKDMDKRELGYYNDYYWQYNLEIIQYVIFLGPGKPTMKAEINHQNLSFRYNIIVMNQIDVDLFLNSDNPHEIILAVLCKYTRKEAPKIIKQILEKLSAKAQNERDLHEYVTDLEILSGLRKLQSETKKQVQKMPVIYDLTKDIRFKEGVEVGEERGEARGEARGQALGALNKARNTAIRMLKQEEFSIVKIAELLDVPLDFVVQIQKELQRNPNLK
jgi:predicted transposase/invertase (TIGR01784 family)